MSKRQIESILSQLDASPTPRHLVSYLTSKLLQANFVDYSTKELQNTNLGFIARAGSLIAWKKGKQTARNGFRIVGAHTDSPGLRIKPNPDDRKFGFNTLQVEIYGSPLLNSWLDRDLGIAGHVVLKSGDMKLFRSANPVARISQLAVHLDREVNERGLTLDKHLHLSPAWSSDQKAPSFLNWVAQQTKCVVRDIVSIDAQLFDTHKAAVIGADSSFIASGRLDNQASCWAAISALLESKSGAATQVVALFDHEEVGSESATGAAGPLLEHSLEQIAAVQGISRIGFLEILSKSSCISADNAHAVHHNYPERHDLSHGPIINMGPALKLNSNQRYATSSTSAAMFISACSKAKVKHQVFVSRNNMPCGSTIGPITATRLGIDTVDVGVPQLSMHSSREVCGVSDLTSLQLALKAYFN
ncbi:MAG: M18 family aminopeptidase [Ilumatobacteraceae bacterium]